jgi:hypothetical protein
MVQKRPTRRKRRAAPELTEVLTLRMTPEQIERIRQAAGPYPAATWARVALVEAAERAIKAGR